MGETEPYNGRCAPMGRLPGHPSSSAIVDDRLPFQTMGLHKGDGRAAGSPIRLLVSVAFLIGDVFYPGENILIYNFGLGGCDADQMWVPNTFMDGVQT